MNIARIIGQKVIYITKKKGGTQMESKTCYHCIYFSACGDANRTEPCTGKNAITKDQAKEIYRDLKGSVWGDCNHPNDVSLTIKGIMHFLKVDEKRANAIEDAIIHYGISERQGGGLVV